MGLRGNLLLETFEHLHWLGLSNRRLDYTSATPRASILASWHPLGPGRVALFDTDLGDAWWVGRAPGECGRKSKQHCLAGLGVGTPRVWEGWGRERKGDGMGFPTCDVSRGGIVVSWWRAGPFAFLFGLSSVVGRVKWPLDPSARCPGRKPA